MPHPQPLPSSSALVDLELAILYWFQTHGDPSTSAFQVGLKVFTTTPGPIVTQFFEFLVRSNINLLSEVYLAKISLPFCGLSLHTTVSFTMQNIFDSMNPGLGCI